MTRTTDHIIRPDFSAGRVRLEWKYSPERWCFLVWTPYLTGSPALIINDYNGHRLGTATVWLEQAVLEPGNILVKTWSENEGLDRALIGAGVLIDTGLLHAAGHAWAREMTPTENAKLIPGWRSEWNV